MVKPKQFIFSPLASDKPDIEKVTHDRDLESVDMKKYSRADLEAAEKTGYDKGHAEGLHTGIEQGKGELFQAEQQLNATLAPVLERLAQVMGHLNDTVQQKNLDIIRLATTIGQKVSGEVLEENAAKKIEDFVAQTLPKIFREKAILLKINNELEELLKNKTAALVEEHGFTGKITIVADEHTPISSCEIEWDTGGVEYNPENTWKEIYQILGINEDTPDEKEDAIAPEQGSEAAKIHSETASEQENTLTEEEPQASKEETKS